MNHQKYTEENLKKNVPNKVTPIIYTIFAVIITIGGIVLKIRNSAEFKTLYFILFLILMILFVIATWYTNYFSKIQNTKKIKNYDKETKEIVSYIKRLEHYTGIELNREHKLKFTFEYTDEIIDKNPEYIEEHYSFGLAKENAIIFTVGVSFAGLEFKGYNHELVGLCGVMPKSIWYKKHLKVPKSKKGKIYIEAVGFHLTEKMIIQALKNQDIYYDNKSGWLTVGERKITPIDDAIEVMHDVIVVIRNDELISLWIKIKNNCAL